MLTHSLNFFIQLKESQADTFLQVKDSAVNSACGSFCWNYATDTFYGNYAGDKVSCIYAGFEVVLFVTGMLVDLSVTIKQVTVLLKLCS